MYLINKIIAVDFDGTLCTYKYPDIGKPIEPIINALLREQQNGAKIILWTCRCGKKLEEAIKWCAERGILFDAVNEHLPELKEKFGNDTRKIYTDEYWDDRAFNVFNVFEVYVAERSGQGA